MRRSSNTVGLTLCILITALWGCDSGNDGKQKHNEPKDGDHKHSSTDAGHKGHGQKVGEGHSHVAPHGGVVKTIGSYHLEMAYDQKNATVTLYVLGDSESEATPIEAKPIMIQLKPDDYDGFEDFLAVEMLPIAQEGEPKGKSSRFVGTHAELTGVKSFEATVRVPIDGKVYRTVYQIDPSSMAQVFVCPMACEKGKTYTKAGKCPVCTMDLKHPKHAHADHSPKHGGMLFMAPNAWHHLEGALPKADEFRLYFFNNFTKPISAKPYLEGTSAEVVRLDAERKELGKPVKMTFAAGDDDSFLKIAIPPELALPIDVAVRVQFEGKEKPDLFNFTFDKISQSHDHAEKHGPHEGTSE